MFIHQYKGFHTIDADRTCYCNVSVLYLLASVETCSYNTHSYTHQSHNMTLADSSHCPIEPGDQKVQGRKHKRIVGQWLLETTDILHQHIWSLNVFDYDDHCICFFFMKPECVSRPYLNVNNLPSCIH